MRTLIVVLLGGLAVLALALVSARFQPRPARDRRRSASDDTGLLFLADAGTDSSSADCDSGGSDAGSDSGGGCDGGSGGDS